MNKENDVRLTILVVEDIEETRDGIEKLLQVDGYRVEAARDERAAVESARRQQPDLMLVSLGGTSREVIATARQIRERAELGSYVPVVVFCFEEISAGDEIAIGQNVYITRPDNFDQLRKLLARLLHKKRMQYEVALR
ncbi:MAG TPA: response regulator [Pyrinomonadaceae bacterium]|jgi:CheY-like chemotaxis protein